MAPEPESIGRYRLQQPLEPDSTSWLAEDLEGPTSSVVVKLLPEGSDAIAARHIQELMGSTDLSGINPVIDHGELPDGRPFLVYPLVQGTSLRDFLNSSGPLPMNVAGGVLQQIGKGLEALHQHKLVYGVLSPEHVILQSGQGQMRAVLLNAGAFRVSGQTSTSPGYLAPEQAVGNPTVRSDVFSLGAVSAEVLTGRRAFRYGSLNDLERMQRIGLARGSLRKLRSKIPIRVEEEIRKATSWDPAQRPTDVEVFGARLGEYLGAGRFPRRRIILLGLVSAALGAAGLRNCRRR
ncbi:MAG: protein kinase [Bryobacteraceae bacterium]|nr:protein kinase [Bryobacteraceae bacterium]